MPAVTGKKRSPVFPTMRVHRVGKVLPATTQAPIFNVVGGAVRISSLVGRFTVAGSATATTLKVTANPTVFNDVDLCTAVAITSFAVGRLVGLSGALGSALAVAQAFGGASPGYDVAAGTIDLVTSATNTGQVEWFIEYVPLDPSARITVA